MDDAPPGVFDLAGAEFRVAAHGCPPFGVPALTPDWVLLCVAWRGKKSLWTQKTRHGEVTGFGRAEAGYVDRSMNELHACSFCGERVK